MDDIRLIVACNIIRLRTGAGMTQAELGEKLNYSDKTISKWERAESLPDASVLKQIGELFHVSVDDLLSSHDHWEKPRDDRIAGRRYSGAVVAMVSIAGIWTLAVLAFAILWMLNTIEWRIFVYAVPASLIALLVFNSVWNKRKNNVYIVAALVLSVIAVIYVILIRYRPWQLFLVAVPAELVAVLSFRIRKSRK